MPRMSKKRKQSVLEKGICIWKKRKQEWALFLNERNRITYNELCRKCQHLCKQSFRVLVIDCPHFLRKERKRK